MGINIPNPRVGNDSLAPMPPNTVKVNATNAAGQPIDLLMPPDTILCRRTTGDIVALDSESFAAEFGDSGNSGSSFPMQPAYGDYRIFTRIDLAGDRFYFVPTFGFGEWIALSQSTLEYLDGGGLPGGGYFSVGDQTMNADKGPTFDYRARIVSCTISSGSNMNGSSAFDIRAGGVSVATHSLPGATQRSSFSDAELAAAVIPASTPIQVFALAGSGGGNDTIVTMDVKRAEVP